MTFGIGNGNMPSPVSFAFDTYQGAKDHISKDLLPGVYEIKTIFIVTNQ
jgi:hypothetical protein